MSYKNFSIHITIWAALLLVTFGNLPKKECLPVVLYCLPSDEKARIEFLASYLHIFYQTLWHSANQLYLPTYESREEVKEKLMTAIEETEGFGKVW